MNLSIRNLTDRHAAILTKIRRKYGAGTNTNAAAIARALEEWEYNADRLERLEADHAEALDLMREYTRAATAEQVAQLERAAVISSMLKLTKRKPGKPRQLLIPD